MKKTGLLIVLVSLFQPVAIADTDGQIPVAVKTAIERIMPTTPPDSISAAPVSGMYEIVFGAKVLYMSADGKYLIEGDVFDLNKMKNLTESKRTAGRLKAINKINEDTMIVYKPKKVKHSVRVFTDIDCGYCRKLHREMDSYMEEGIEIKYLAYPRSGKNTPSYHKAVGVWCSEDKQKAMTDAKNGGKAPDIKCDNPVDEHMAIADVVGVTGTPTLVFEDGRVIPGYLPAKRLGAFLGSNPVKKK